MKRCTAALPTTRCWQARRWASHDRSTLTPEALLQKVEAGLGHDEHGNPLHVDLESKTVNTAAGDLPISPLFDPSWIRSRRRETKRQAAPPKGRFRKELSLNPYARALATPLRQCGLTNALVPRHLLQDIELVSHPATEKLWYAPGPLACEHVVPVHRRNEDSTEIKDEGVEQSLDQGENEGQQATTHEPQSGRSPIRVYVLNRKDMLDRISPDNRLAGAVMGPRSGASHSAEMRKKMRTSIWRSDLSDVILHIMRRTVVDTLIKRADTSEGRENNFVKPVSNWEAIKDVPRRQGVLWLPREAADGDTKAPAASEYATLDVDGDRYYGKMPVHNLNWLLGSEEVARLKVSMPEIYGRHEVVVLKGWRSYSSVNLHMLLWRLHGYLASTPALPAGSSKSP